MIDRMYQMALAESVKVGSVIYDVVEKDLASLKQEYMRELKSGEGLVMVR